jgi:hypothetical protein
MDLFILRDSTITGVCPLFSALCPSRPKIPGYP